VIGEGVLLERSNYSFATLQMLAGERDKVIAEMMEAHEAELQSGGLPEGVTTDGRAPATGAWKTRGIECF